MTLQTDAVNLEQRLAGVIASRRTLLTAYSGGVDSTVVAAVARRTLGKQNAPAAIGDSASLPRYELEEARRIAEQLDLNLIEVQPGEQDDPDYRANDGSRCYFCKTHLYGALGELAERLSIDWIANGTNRDDTGDHRPGLVAAEENRVVSPLLEADFGKAEVRVLAEHLKLPNADKPAAACMASRLQYGTAVTPQRLAMIEDAETVLREMGFAGFRVRHHENESADLPPVSMARIEVPIDQLQKLVDGGVRSALVSRLNAIGYVYVTLDLAGFRSGSANVVLTRSAVNR